MKVFIPNSFIINAMAKEQYMISLESVSLDIDNTQIFSDLNLCVKENEKFLIQGRSGMGKTSLFRLILGFEQPQSGQILVNGLPLDKNHITRIRQQIFYLSQDIDLKNEIIIRQESPPGGNKQIPRIFGIVSRYPPKKNQRHIWW
jgi:ABC-type bacteriocin/lantibiotic exporter with double-glycine peptidase domain